jgi:hypothetical protein
VSSCSMGTMNSISQNSHVSLMCGNTLRQASLLQATIIKPSAYMPISQKDRCFDDFNSLLQEEFFLVNCTFLI